MMPHVEREDEGGNLHALDGGAEADTPEERVVLVAFGAYLEELRKIQGVTQRTVAAAAVDSNPTQVQRVERGTVHTRLIPALRLLALGGGTSDDLIDLLQHPNPTPELGRELARRRLLGETASAHPDTDTRRARLLAELARRTDAHPELVEALVGFLAGWDAASHL